MAGADRATGGAVAGFQCGFHILRLPGAGADAFQCADKAAHLIVQKTARPHVKMHFGTGQSHDPLDAQLIQGFLRALRLTDRRAEGGEIMVAEQVVGRLLHGVDIQIIVDLPDLARVMGGGCAADQDAKQILPLDGGKPCVPLRVDLGAVHNRHGRGLQVKIQRLRQAKGSPGFLQITMGHLSQPMHAGICAACRGNGMGTGFQPGERIFDRALHRGLIFLPLPSGKGLSVVFNFESKTRHERASNPATGLRQVLRQTGKPATTCLS